MLFATKIGRSYPVRISKIDRVETAGWDAIHASSRPPYGSHIEPHKARMWGANTTNLENVRVVDTRTEARLGRIQRHIEQLRKTYQAILEDNFLSFRLANIADFDKAIIHAGLTREEAAAKLPKGEEAKKMVKQGKMLAGLTRNLGSVLR